MNVYVFEDGLASNFLPITYTRATFDLQAGIRSILENILSGFTNPDVSLIVRPFIADITAQRYPGFNVNPQSIEEGLWINGRMLFKSQEIKNAIESKGTLFYKDDSLAMVYLSEEAGTKWMKEGGPVEVDLGSGMPKAEISPTEFRFLWDMGLDMGNLITEDFQEIYGKGEIAGKVYQNVSIVDEKSVYVAPSAVVKPGVVLDAEGGPIIIDDDAVVMANAVVEGPVYLGKGSRIKIGAKVYENTYIGPVSKVGGELEASIIQGYTNKQHEGFMGHAYLGEWINIGADSNNSDLKNNYGSVKVWVNGKVIDSGSLFVGLIMGDHTKTGINSMFNTGTVVGVGCNIYGSGYPTKYIPSFSWGGAAGFQDYRLDKMLETAKAVKNRRKLELTNEEIELLTDIFKRTESERKW